MGLCSVVGCKNRNGKDIRLYRFPRDPARRREWEIKLRRKDWSPNEHSRICQVHFEDDQFESQRLDGWKKLKPNVTPTIFPHLPPPKHRKPPMKRQLDDSSKKRVFMEHLYSKQSRYISSSSNVSPALEPESNPNSEAESSTHTGPVESLTDAEEAPSALGSDLQIGEEVEVTTTLSLSTTNYREKQLEAANKELNQKLHNLEQRLAILTANIEKVFNQDQISAMSYNSTRGHKWSIETMQKALRLRFTCGSSGYEELIKEGLPYPSLRTLRRYIEGFSFDSDAKVALQALVQTIDN